MVFPGQIPGLGNSRVFALDWWLQVRSWLQIGSFLQARERDYKGAFCRPMGATLSPTQPWALHADKTHSK